MSEPNNQERAAMAARVLEHFPDSGCLEETIIDLITDLLHLAKQQNLNALAIVSVVAMHFDAEAEKEASHG